MCASNTGGFPENNEIVFRLTNPGGTTVNLINANTFPSGAATSAGTVTMTFSDAGGALPSAPATGTFHPVGSLSTFNGSNPNGTWTLFIQDTVSIDHLCVNNFTLTVLTSGTAAAPAAPGIPGADMITIPSGSVVGTFLVDTPLYYAPNAGAASSITMQAGKTLWVFGMSKAGDFYQVVLAGQKLWVPVGVIGPTAAAPWYGKPLPTTVVG